MATFTVTTNSNFDSLATKTGADIYNINGAVLTIDGDSRYDANCSTTIGSAATITISATLGGELKIDGTAVRLVPIDNVGTSGTIPAAGSDVTQGGVTGKLIGVWTAINVAPLASGSAWPATGYMKVKQVAGGAFAAGNVTVGASTGHATGVDVPGWIELSFDEAGTLTISRLGKLTITGDWFTLGTCSGSRNQTMVLPTSGGTAFWVPGVWIETGSGTDVYNYWPCLTADTGGGWTNGNQSTNAYSRFVQCTGALIRIGSDGTNNIGALPVSGAKVRIPNIFLQQNTTLARASTAKPNATIGTRFETVLTGAGVININKASVCWYLNMLQPYSVDMVDVAVADSILIQECASAVNWNSGGTGTTNPLDTPGMVLTTCLAGGTLQNLRIGRSGTIGSSDNAATIANCIGQTFNNCFYYQGTLRTNATLGFALNISQSTDLTFIDCTFCPSTALQTCSVCTFTNTVTIDRMVSTTLTTYPTSCFVLTAKCANITINGISQGGYSNVQPYNSLVSITACDNIKVRNIGTPGSRLNLGGTNASRYIWQLGGNNNNIELKRIYTSGAATSAGTALNSDKNITIQNVWGGAADKVVGSGTVDAPLNATWKGNYGESGTPQASFTSVYGSHFWDSFISATAGRQGIIMNEATAETASYVSLAGTSEFTSAGSLYLPNANDTCEWIWPHYVLGITSITIANPTVTGGTSVADRLRFQYQIDKNNGSGFGSYHNLRYPCAGGSGTSGQFTFTVTDATGVEIGDYAFGTGVGTNARVTNIASNTITVNVANSATVSGIVVFNQLPFEGSISSTNGYKLKVKVTVLTTSTSNTLTGFYFGTTTDATAQQTQYPLELVPVTLTGLKNPTEVRIFNTATTTEITGQESITSGTYTAYIDVGTYPIVDISILALGYQNTRLLGLSIGTGLNIPVQQQLDRQYFNP